MKILLLMSTFCEIAFFYSETPQLVLVKKPYSHRTLAHIEFTDTLWLLTEKCYLSWYDNLP